MTRFELLAEESVRLCPGEDWRHSMYHVGPIASCSYHFSSLPLSSHLPNGFVHFSVRRCSSPWFIRSTVACIHPDTPDTVAYHAVGACPYWRRE